MIRLFKVFVPVGTMTLLTSEILLLLSAFVIAAYTLPVDPTAYLLYDGGLLNVVLLLIGMLLVLYLEDLYSDIYVRSRIGLLLQLCGVIGSAFVLQGMISYVSGMRIPLRVMAVGGVLSISAIFCWRLVFRSFVMGIVGRDRLLLVGNSSLLMEIADYIVEHPEHGFQVTGYVDDSEDPGAQRPGGKVLGRMADLREVVAATDPTRIVVGMFDRRMKVPNDTLLELRFAGCMIEEAATVYEKVCGRVSLKELRPSQLIYSGELGPSPQTMVFQSVWNLIIATVGLVVGAPIMLLTALAVKLSSPGPVLYRQTRVGLNGRLFSVYKFRSMRVDAESGTGAVWAKKDDPRVTPVGKFIRKVRFDELPQIFNVLRGEMSIVGPRPERPEFDKTLSQIPYYRQRHCVRPGITGWAQINYRYSDDIENTKTKLEYDLYYIKHMSMSLDAYIIFHTVKTMLLSRGSR
jgi:sugar transferase (PEP-CTERM system associated)